jgi:hypothetical protein
MSTHAADRSTRTDDRRHDHTVGTVETKPAFKTTELVVWAVTVLAVLIAAAVTENLDGHDAWKYVTWLSVGYMISRGLAKAGSYQRDNDPRSGD